MFRIIRETHILKAWINSIDTNELGLVPTMGNLHKGHLSLAQKSLEEKNYTLVTIFVNPKQFGLNEDLESYPRTLETDCELLTSLFEQHKEKQLVVFAPKSIDQIYPEGFSTVISVKQMANILCGTQRPGHFDGVTTVVYRLFALSKATSAYFGQKDFQQVSIIKKMVEDLSLDVKVEMLPISRDKDGLARSSRNQFLSEKEREDALTLPKTLVELENILKEKSWTNAGIEINDILETILKDDRFDYIELLDANSLKEVNSLTTQVSILAAMRLGTTRLIDNRLVEITYA